MNLFISPHCDDETLFGAYTIMNEKPKVYIWETTPERLNESIEALKILGGEFTDTLKGNWEKVYAPALENGHPLHDECHNYAKDRFENVIYYSTYRSGEDLQSKGNIKVEATEEMKQKKIEALKCYKSQIEATPCHFKLENKDEYYI
jgi:LmbE family N-acetylglucosaminyl deacetylase